MEAFQKLKTLAFQCTFRRRKTLRRFLRIRFSSRRRRHHADLARTKQAAAGKKGLIASHSLKDLFVKSPPQSPAVIGGGGDCGDWKKMSLDGGEVIGRRVGLAGLRHRLMRPAWRPKLVAIPEMRTEDFELLLGVSE